VSGDDAYEVTDRLDDSAPRVLRRVFVIAVVLVFLIGLPFGTTATVIGVLIGALALAVELLLPRERLVARSQLLLVGKATQSDSAFGAVYEGLRDRQVPGEVRPNRVRAGGGVRNVLTIRLGAYRATVTVSEFGSGLALGWTLAHRQLPVQGVVHWLATSLGAEPARDEPVWVLADAVNGAVGHAAESVLAGREVSLAEAFGRDVPVEDRSVPAPPPPGPVGPPSDHGGVPAQPAAGGPNGPGGPGGGLGEPGGPGGLVGPGGPGGPAVDGSGGFAGFGGFAGMPTGPASGPVPMGPDGPPTGGSLIPGMDDENDRTALIPPPPRFAPFEFTVGLPVEVFTPEGAVVGRLEPGTRYWAVDEHPSGLVVQIAAGAALLRDRGALRRD
jgi:hypothetical protein